jgi:proteasome accessory factor B
VRFNYRLPGRDDALLRSVAPLRLHRVDDRWHLIAWDLDRDAGRVFLLSRIVGEVRDGPAAFDAELHDRADQILAELLQRRERERATLHVRPGSVAQARLSTRYRAGQGGTSAGYRDPEPLSGNGYQEVTLGMLDAHVLASELVGYGADVTVVAPPELRDLVVAQLRAVASAHDEVSDA